jgi:C-8 sterol isomerase
MPLFVFDPDVVHAVAVKAIDDTPGAGPGYHERLFANVVAGLSAAYPDKIEPRPTWLFNFAAGVELQICPLYASLTEQVFIWGTPVQTSGYSGRNPVTYHDTVLDGEVRYALVDRFEPLVYRPRDAILLPAMKGASMAVPGHVWALELGQGAIGLEMPFGLAGTFFSTLDYVTLAETMAVYTRLMIRAYC